MTTEFRTRLFTPRYTNCILYAYRFVESTFQVQFSLAFISYVFMRLYVKVNFVSDRSES